MGFAYGAPRGKTMLSMHSVVVLMSDISAQKTIHRTVLAPRRQPVLVLSSPERQLQRPKKKKTSDSKQVSLILIRF